jgi:hypothetical protein
MRTGMVFTRRLIKQTHSLKAVSLTTFKKKKKKKVSNINNKDTIVRNVQEATLDSRVLVLSADLSAQKAKALRLGGESFSLDEFVSKVISVGKNNNEDFDRDEDEELDWKLLGKKAMRIGKRGHSIDFM